MVKEERIAVGGVYGMAELSHTTDQHGGGRRGDDEELEGGKGFILS